MKNFITKFICVITIIGFTQIANGQQKYTLEQIISLSKQQSPFALQANNRKLNRYWQYRTYQSNYKPRLVLSGNLPDYSNSLTRIGTDEGDQVIVRQQFLNNDVNLSLNYGLSLTGGEVFFSSGLQRIQQIRDTLADNIFYLSTPLSIGINQPIFGFNQLKWDKRIEPLRYEESQKAFSEEMERIAVQATDLFFNLLVAQITLKISELNKANNDTIYKIAQGRYNVGKIAENELLQLQLNSMQSDQQVTQARLDIETSELSLKIYLGNNEGLNNVQLAEPLEVPDITVDEDKAIAEAKKNRARYIEFKRQTLEAERDIARARGNAGLRVNVSGSFGLSQNASTIPGAYQNFNRQERFQIGFQIPILDWGRQKASVQTAVANHELVKSTVKQNEQNFEQEILLKVKQFKIFRSRLLIAKKADEIAQRRYDIAQKRYLIAKINITDLNIALQDKDNAKRGYLEALRRFWKNYYEIRQLTLYDFERNEPIRY